jgi:hypothetical protein
LVLKGLRQVQKAAKPASRSMKANPYILWSPADHESDVGGRESFPRPESDDLAVDLVQSRQREAQTRYRIAVDDRSIRGAGRVTIDRRAKPQGETVLTPSASAMVGKHSPGDAVEPRRCFPPGRNVVKPSPNDQKHIGKKICGVTSGVHSPKEVREQRFSVLYEEPVEGRFTRTLTPSAAHRRACEAWPAQLARKSCSTGARVPSAADEPTIRRHSRTPPPSTWEKMGHPAESSRMVAA